MPCREIVNLVEKISSESSRNKKVELLKNCNSEFSEGTFEFFKEVLNLIYNPEISFGVTFNSDWEWSHELAQPSLDLDQMLSLMDDFANRFLTGNEALSQAELYFTRAANEDVFKIGKMCLDKTLGCGIDEKTVRKVFPDLLPFRPNMMKCEPANEKTLENAVFPAMLQVKSDGMRLMIHVIDGEVVEMFTFNGTRFMIDSVDLHDDVFILSQSLKHTVGDNIWLDGELLFLDDKTGKVLPRKKGNGLANSILKKTAAKSVHKRARVALWDCISHDHVIDDYSPLTNENRFATLKEAVESRKLGTISLIEHLTVSSMEECNDTVDSWIECGEEGGILKNCHAPWEGKRSDQCFKFKSEKENEFKAIGVVDGKREFEGLIGSITMVSSDSLVVSDVSGISMKDRCQWSADYYKKTVIRKEKKDGVVTEYIHEPSDEFKMGDIFTIRYNELIDKKGSEIMSLFLPRIVEKRIDKNEADDLKTIKATKNRKKG